MTETSGEKIVALDTLAQRAAAARAEGRRVVLCHGVFDLLHIGHMRYFERARALGDLLIVTVTPDRFVDKGAFRPAFPEALRLEAIAALSVVDHVAVNAWPTAEDTLRTLRPAVYAKGAEFRQIGADATGKMEVERAVAAEIGCELAFIDDVVFSSSQLINLHLRSYPDEVAEYLAPLRDRWSASVAAELLARIAKLSILVVGPTIDETTVMVDCHGLGRDAEPVLRTVDERRRLVGAPVLARALVPLAGSVELLTLADGAPLRSELPGAGIHARSPAAGLGSRRRFVDAAGKVWLTTLDGATDADDEDIAWIDDRLDELVPSHDVVVVVDQGRATLVRASLSAAGVHVAHLPDGGPARSTVDLTLWLHAEASDERDVDTGTVVRLTRDGAAELRRDRETATAPSITRDSSASGADAFAAVCCLADAAGAEPELTLLMAQAARLLASTGDPTPSRERLQKQLTSMLK